MKTAHPSLAYVVNSLNPGGTERLVVQMTRTFRTEYDLSVICLDEPGLWGEQLRRDSIPVHCLWRQPGLDVSMPVKLASFCRKHRIDIIHAHQCTPWFYGALSRLLHGAPRLLLQEHGRFYPEVKNGKRATVNRHLIKPLTHRFIAVSRDVRNRLAEYEGLTATQIEVIYNGVEPAPPLASDTRAHLRRDLGFSPDEFVVGTVGRFDPIKNLPLLLKSLAMARREMPSLRGLLVGDGPAFDEIKTLRDALGLSLSVVMTGHREDARKLVQCMDLFILSSFSEGTSVALLEAMAAGVPVAVTAVGGNPEIVIAGETGWVVESDSVEQLSEALRDATAHPQKGQQFGEAGRRRFEERFTFERMIGNYRKVYTDMLRT